MCLSVCMIIRVKTKIVGVIARQSRRRVLNAPELISAASTIQQLWCDSLGYAKDNEEACRVVIQLVEFGNKKPYEAIIPQLASLPNTHCRNQANATNHDSIYCDMLMAQSLAVLMGVQGSGLINGLYMPKASCVVAYYPRDSWPVVSGDPLATLSQRGPYIRYIDPNPSECHGTNSDQVPITI